MPQITKKVNSQCGYVDWRRLKMCLQKKKKLKLKNNLHAVCIFSRIIPVDLKFNITAQNTQEDEYLLV